MATHTACGSCNDHIAEIWPIGTRDYIGAQDYVGTRHCDPPCSRGSCATSGWSVPCGYWCTPDTGPCARWRPWPPGSTFQAARMPRFIWKSNTLYKYCGRSRANTQESLVDHRCGQRNPRWPAKKRLPLDTKLWPDHSQIITDSTAGIFSQPTQWRFAETEFVLDKSV